MEGRINMIIDDEGKKFLMLWKKHARGADSLWDGVAEKNSAIRNLEI